MVRTGIAIAIFVFAAAGLQASPIVWGGHTYEVVEAYNQDWTWARAEAESRMFQGVSGYLATITTPEENAFILGMYGQFTIDYGYCIGAFQPVGSPEPAGNWQWVTGETWDYANWGPSEPNNFGSGPNADVAVFYFESVYLAPGFWGEWEGGHPQGGYIVEYEVPEPATMALLGVGGLAMIRRRRKA